MTAVNSPIGVNLQMKTNADPTVKSASPAPWAAAFFFNLTLQQNLFRFGHGGTADQRTEEEEKE